MSEDKGYYIRVTGDESHFHRIRRLVHFASLQQGIDEQVADVIERAVAEACTNALFYKSSEQDDSSFVLEMHLTATRITSVVKNRGAAFNFDNVAPFDIHQDFMEYQNGGLGIPIMKRLMDEVHYERIEGDLNVVTLIKHINPNHQKGATETDEN